MFEIIKEMRKYRPYSGSEGIDFEKSFCMQCLHCDPNPEGKKQCDILCRAICFDIDEKEYPDEWIYDVNNNPTCTNWQKWDWGNDGDPDDPDNPKAPPPPPDPNQYNLFPLYPDERNFISTRVTHKTID